MLCSRCQDVIPAARERAILQHRLDSRCVPCQSKVEKRAPAKPKVKDEALACGSAWDGTLEHLIDRQGIL